MYKTLFLYAIKLIDALYRIDIVHMQVICIYYMYFCMHMYIPIYMIAMQNYTVVAKSFRSPIIFYLFVIVHAVQTVMYDNWKQIHGRRLRASVECIRTNVH